MTTPPDFRALLSDDSYAATFQSLGQYRSALLKALPEPMNTPPLAHTPVSERLPGVWDCDAEGRYWIGICDSAGLRTWSLVRLRDVSAWVRNLSPVWLPHWAIPLPEEL